tara:strand:- start:157 stop:813 length:657 start_codon:yes stop_codon:yes gene_type:complete
MDVLGHIDNEYTDKCDLVITGDLSSDFSEKSYENIRDLLKQFTFGVSILPGNHDDLEMMKNICDEQISLEPLSSNDKAFAIFNFDTHVQDNVRGYINESEIQNLEDYLLKNKSEVIIFTHHPIIKVDSQWIDENITVNNNLLVQLMLKHGNISFHIFSGHVHQEFHKRIRNIDFYTSPSTCYQFKSKSEKFCVDDKLGNGYRVITLRDNTLKTDLIRL